MKNKKGFTLIELLAVIVILAIIALITTPIVLNLINQSKEAANKRSVEAYAKAVEYAVAQYEYEHNGELPADFDAIKNDIEYSNSDVKCNVAINCDNKGSVELTGCQVGSYTNNVYSYSSTKGNKGAAVDSNNAAPSGSTSVKLACTQYVYQAKYDAENDEAITTASEGRTERPTDYNVYLRYRLENDEIVTPPDACIYSDAYGGELCLVYGDYSNNVTKIKTYFNINDSEIVNGDYSKDGVSCGFYSDNIGCSIIFDGGAYIEFSAVETGFVQAWDGYDSSVFFCRVEEPNYFYCSWT